MNITHLRYAVEVEKAKSINKAAENLYMGQPNLSRAIRELEEELGITIFNRSSRGMTITPEGEEFLSYAHRILEQVSEVEAIYKTKKHDRQKFTVSVPRASYISHAFSEFSKAIDTSRPVEIYYKETNSKKTINKVLTNEYKLGIIRYSESHDKHFKNMLEEKGLTYEIVAEFSYVLIMSKDNPLASKPTITYDDLSPFIEIAHADPYVPSLSMSKVFREELPDNIGRRIFVFERASQFDLLSGNPETFMWVSPASQEILDRYNLVQRVCEGNKKTYKDILIYHKGYRLTKLDNEFITALTESRRKYLN